MKRRGAATAAALLVVGAVLVLQGVRWLRRPSPEQQIRAAVAQFERGLEEGNVRLCLGIVSRRFEGQGYTQPDVARGLWELTRDTSQVHFFVDRLDVRIMPGGRTAEVTAYVAFFGSGSMGEWSFGQDQPVPVQATFVREGRAWRAITCSGFPTVPSWY